MSAPEGRTELLITGATAVLGGVRGEQYRIEPDTAIAIADRRIRWIGTTAEAAEHSADRVIDAHGKYAVRGL